MKKKFEILMVEDNEEYLKSFEKKVINSKSINEITPDCNVDLAEAKTMLENIKDIEYLSNLYNVNFNITVAKTFEDYESIKDSKDFDVVLTDLFIPYSNNSVSNKGKVENRWEEGLEEASKISTKGIMKGELAVRDFHRHIGENSNVSKQTDYLDKNTWEKMNGSDRLVHFASDHTLDLSADGNNNFDINTAPFGIDVFLEQHYEKGKPVCMVTSDHAHGGEGSPFMIYLQNEGLDKYGKIPFASLDSNDLRLMNGMRKSNSEYSMKEVIENVLILHKLHKAGYKDDSVADASYVISNLLIRKAHSPNDRSLGILYSKEDLLLGRKEERLNLSKKIELELEHSIKINKIELADKPDSSYLKESIVKTEKELKIVRSKDFSPINYLHKNHSIANIDGELEETITNGLKIIKETFYNNK